MVDRNHLMPAFGGTLHPWFTVLAAVAALAACGDGAAGAGDRPTVVRRDSAGIEIVENARPAWSTDEAWTVDTDPLFIIHASDGGPENRLLDPTSIDVDSRGHIIVGDGDQAGWDAVLVYDSLGRFLFQAGRQGRGPGEFGQLWWASTYRGDSIVAFDMSGTKLELFGPEGRFARQVRLPSMPSPDPPPGTYGYVSGVAAAFADGSFLAYPPGVLEIPSGAGPAWYQHLLVRLAPDGKSWDSLGTFTISQQYWSGHSQEPIWFAPISVSTVGRGALYFGRGDRFEIARYDSTGRLTRLIRRPYQPRPVTETLRRQTVDWFLDRLKSSPEMSEQMLERMKTMMESGQFAEALPPYSAILLDDAGDLWVEEFRWFSRNQAYPAQGPTHWSVFDTSGAWLGTVDTPPGFILHHVEPDRALGFVIDSLDVKELYVYRLERHARP